MLMNRSAALCLLVLLLLPVSAFAQLQGGDVDRVRRVVADPSLAQFIITHAKRVSFMRNQIVRLNFDGQGIPHVPENIHLLIGLEYLSLEENNLSVLPDSIGQLASLETLEVSRNNLHVLPETIGGLTSLKRLSASRNKLTHLPSGITELAHLKDLVLIGNDLVDLPEGFERLTNLEDLTLVGNEFTTLPLSIGKLPKLRKLDIKMNKLTQLPENIGDLSTLKFLYAMDNKLTRLPDSLPQLTALQGLGLSFNQLTTLPNGMGSLVNLRRITLGDNPLQQLPLSITKLDQLETIGTNTRKDNNKYDRRYGETTRQFFDRCYTVSWRDDSVGAVAQIAPVQQAPAQQVPAEQTSAEPARKRKGLKEIGRSAGRELGKALRDAILKKKKPETPAAKQDVVQPAAAPAPAVAPPPAAPVELTHSRHLKVASATVKAHTPIRLDYVEMPGNQGDWITLVKANLPEDTYGDYFYPYGKATGSYSFGGVTPGEYEIRVYYDWPSGGYRVQDRLRLKVVP